MPHPNGANPTGVPIIGQPFTITAIGVPVNVVLTCNCGGGGAAVEIKLSTPATCPSCRRTYNAVFNPQVMKVEMHVSVPQGEQVPS